MNNSFLDNAKIWLSENFDEDTRKKVKSLIDSEDKDSLRELFYADLEFGTGGMRGKMDVGTNRMNIYTVGRATQGLALHIVNKYNGEITAVIAHDTRRNSKIFCERAACVLAANNITTWIFSEPTPTPLLSFAVRYLKAKCGIVITASHNPPEYNGYKVYGNDGCQLVSPEDGDVMAKVKETTFDQVKSADFEEAVKEGKIMFVPQALIQSYENRVIDCLTDKERCIREGKNVSIIYSPLHGAGYKITPEILKKAGFTNVQVVPEQSSPDGEFPTVKYPNPEDENAWKLILDFAVEKNADIAMANDPDADRIGLAVRDDKRNFVLLNGNQTGALMLKHILSRKSTKTIKPYAVKTIVTSELWSKIAEYYKTEIFDTLTGFKYIGELISGLEKKSPEMDFLMGGEESYGYLTGTHARDKDGINAALIIAEIASEAKSENTTTWNKLQSIYGEFGFFREKLLNFTFEGIEGKKKIEGIMSQLRNNPPKKSTGSNLILLKDYLQKEISDGRGTLIGETDLPVSNVISLEFENGTKIVARPSGTEPKIKLYFFANGKDEPETEKRLEKAVSEYLLHLGIK
ncbi:phospho-sugar mutase [candidate division WOR-3 bacterium]|nr:phospho-sugar mutase [candidate division WOR-3 bacterium]